MKLNSFGLEERMVRRTDVSGGKSRRVSGLREVGVPEPHTNKGDEPDEGGEGTDRWRKGLSRRDEWMGLSWLRTWGLYKVKEVSS